MTDDATVGAFVCDCAGTCALDLETVRERIDGVEIAASSDLLCGDETVADVRDVVESRGLEDVIVTCPAAAGQASLERIEAETDATVHFVDQREGAGWVHDERAATEKTARLVNARRAALDHDAGEADPATDTTAGRSVAVVGDAELAASLPASADVTLVADGEEFDDVDVDLEGVHLERGRVVDVSGSVGGFEVTLEARVTDDCIDCLRCVEAGPDGAVTRTPVDVAPDAPDGEWVDVCPTNAIDLRGTRRTIRVDQVVDPGAEKPAPGGKTGFHTAGGLATVAAVTALFDANLASGLEYDAEVCAAGDSGQEGCTACHEVCPHDAVSRPAPDEVAFDLTACQTCGACTSTCPTGAVELPERSNERLAREVEALLTAEPGGGLLDRAGPAIDSQVVAFVCSERAKTALECYGRLAASGRAGVEYPPILPVAVDCTDTVGEAHVLHALAAGADGVAILGCGRDCGHSGPDPKAELVDRLNRATTDLGLGERAAFFAPEADDPEGFAASLAAFVDGLSPTPVPPGEYEASGRAFEADETLPAYGNSTWALESVRAILTHVEPARDRIRGLENFGVMTVSDACGLTPTCSNLCPVDAISNEDGRLEFSHERCVNCGLCETGCPESAITMETGLDLELLPERNGGDAWTVVHEDELFACLSCGAEFTSVATVENMKAQLPDAELAEGHMAEYCSDCKGELAFKL